MILTAATGEEGLAILKRKDVDLVLLDVRLPGISGLELLTIVKENYSLVEVIMVSALSEVEVAVRAMKQGAYHGTVTKEFDYDGLRLASRACLTAPLHGEELEPDSLKSRRLSCVSGPV